MVRIGEMFIFYCNLFYNKLIELIFINRKEINAVYQKMKGKKLCNNRIHKPFKKV